MNDDNPNGLSDTRGSEVIVVEKSTLPVRTAETIKKILNQAKNEGKLLDVNFQNIEYFSFDVTNKEIANLLDVKFQTTLLIFKDNNEVYRSLGETTEDLIYEALKKAI